MTHDRYIGVPFVEGGASLDGCDCWGLVRLVYREQLAIDLPKYSDVSPSDVRAVARHMREGVADGNPLWRLVDLDPVQKWDVVLMRIASATFVAHVGIVLDDRRFLHVERAAATTIARFDDPLYRHRIAGFARHRDL